MSSGTENSSMANLTVECQKEGKGRCLGLGQAAYRSWHFAHLSRTARNTEEADIPSHFIMPAAWKHPSGPRNSQKVPWICQRALGEGQEATVIPRCYSSLLLSFIPNHKVEFSRSSMTGVLQQWKCRESSHPNSGFMSLGSMVCALVCFLLPW